jgi:CheY-like chemotaxis protein
MQKILVVDDDSEQRELYSELFKEQGFDVVEASDGLAALDVALKQKFDLIFTGIIMPKMDGFEMIRNLRNNVATALTPVVMFSHLGREEDRQKALKLNRVTFVVKGYDSPSEILNQVKELVAYSNPYFHKHDTSASDDNRQGSQML